MTKHRIHPQARQPLQPRARRSRARSKNRQIDIDFHTRTRGGKRRGAGRKPVTLRGGVVRAGVPHRCRSMHKASVPVHVTIRIDDNALLCMRTLRQRDCYRVLHKAFVHGCLRDHNHGSFRICHYSVQRSHIHLIIEATSRKALSRGMQGFNIRVARGLNTLFQRKGRVLGDRYHEEPLTNPRQVRNTLAYVLNNARRHGEHRDVLPYLHQTWKDPYSSAMYFDGWHQSDAANLPRSDKPRPVAPASTWLLAHGWQRHGLIPVDFMPAAGRLA